MDDGKASYEKLIKKAANDAVFEIENGGRTHNKSYLGWICILLALIIIAGAVGAVCCYIWWKRSGTVTHAFKENVQDICRGTPGTWIDVGVRANEWGGRLSGEFHDHVFICTPNYEIEIFPETKKWCKTGGRTIEILPSEESQKAVSLQRVSRHICDLNPEIPNSKSITELHEIPMGSPLCPIGDMGIYWKMYYLDKNGDIATDTTQYIYVCHKFNSQEIGGKNHRHTFRLYDEPAGRNCAIGGFRAELATDDCRHGLAGDRDAVLYICDLAGPITPAGSAFEVHLITDFPDKNTCPDDGWKVEKGSAGIDGSLDRSKPVKSKIICNPETESKHNYLNRCDDG